MRRAALALVLLAGLAGSTEAATKRYAMIVANGTSLTKGVSPLQFADDDGARYYELLSNIADVTRVYTILDPQSQRLYPEVAKAAFVPRRDDVLRGLAEIFTQARADVDRGDDVIFTFVLVGHGEIGAGGEGYVSLLDAPFTRTDLFREVLAKSPATTNHIVVDACNSYFLVNARGDAPHADDSAPSEAAAVQAMVSEENLSRYPNTGVILSTSSARESHEWSGYGAGVFSHQLRSAMLGTADVNGDGKIEYSEIQAFVAAANLRIDDPKARVELYARAPAIDVSRPLVDLTTARFTSWLRIPAGAQIQFYLEDARGLRVLDANLEGERAVVIALAPSPHYYVRSGANEQRIALGRGGRIDLRRDRMRSATVALRGAKSEAFREGLFAVAYGQRFYEGYVGRSNDTPVRASATAWTPAAPKIDRGYLAAEIERLNARTADAGLKHRLRAASPAIVEALAAEDFATAALILAEADAGE